MTYDYNEWLKNPIKIFCKCGCGTEIIIKSNSHKYYNIPEYIIGHNRKINHPMNGKHHSNETRQKMSENHADICGDKNPFYNIHFNRFGDKSPNWKGGISSLTMIIRFSKNYNEWRLQIFGRDNFTCQYCGVKGIYLESHHIKSFNEIIKEYNIKKLEDALNCDLLWDLNNGITYCKTCHNKLKKKGGIL